MSKPMRAVGCGVATFALALSAACTTPGEKQDRVEGSHAVTDRQTLPAADDRCTADRVGGSAKFAMFSGPTTLDPASAGAAIGTSHLTAIYGTLMRYDSLEKKYVPYLAESLEADESSKVYTLRLRPDATFGNGDSVTSQDVVASIERVGAPDSTSSQASDVKVIKAMETPDERTVIFRLSHRYIDFPYLLASTPGMVVNQKVLRKFGSERLAIRPPSGAGMGPYTVESELAPGQPLKLAAKQDYFGGPVCIQELTLGVIATPAQTFNGLRNGEFDGFVSNDPQVLGQVLDGDHPYFVVGTTGTGIVSNFDAIDDDRVRQAMVKAIDSDRLNEDVLDGLGMAAHGSPVDPSLPWMTDDKEWMGYDPKGAKRLLAEAKADGFDGTLTYHYNNHPFGNRLHRQITTMFERVGFKIEGGGIPLQQFVQNVLVTRNFEVAGWVMNFGDRSCASCGTQSFVTGGAGNVAGVANPEFDAVLAELRTAATDEDRRSVVTQMVTIWNESPPTAPAIFMHFYFTHADRMRGVLPGPAGANNVLFHQAYLTTD